MCNENWRLHFFERFQWSLPDTVFNIETKIHIITEFKFETCNIFPFGYIYSIWLDLLHDDVRNYRDEQCYTQLVAIILNRFYLWIAGLRFIALKKNVPLSSLKKCNCKRIIQSLLIAFGFIEFIWESEIIEEIEIYCINETRYTSIIMNSLTFS